MLREIRNAKQIDGEPLRRWFFSHDLDLIVWSDLTGVPCAFQLAYDKYTDEHLVSWHNENGYCHYFVDDRGRRKTPLLYAKNSSFKRDTVLEQFIKLSGDLPLAITELVATKLREFNEPIREASNSRTFESLGFEPRANYGGRRMPGGDRRMSGSDRRVCANPALLRTIANDRRINMAA